MAIKLVKTIGIAGIKFKYKTPSSLMREIWSEASRISKSIRNMDKQRQALLKAFRDLDWKEQMDWCKKHDPDNN